MTLYRRLFLKPAGISKKDATRLGKQLASAVEVQKALAVQSPHVLELLGELREDEQSFYIDHEPAEPMPLAAIFDPTLPGAGEQQLLLVARALFDVLKLVHGNPRPSAAQPPLSVHGGLCGGVLLSSADGVEKISDFGFATAACNVLGVDSYLNLAVSPRDAASSATGAWEILAPDEFERADRLCAFIDPEKYGANKLANFEPSSDIIAAGILLHLMAEHQHPYLFAEPDAHRIPDACMFMGELLYNGARRKDLRESNEPAVKLWCELVARMLARLSSERPTAAELAEALAPYVKPIDVGEVLKYRLVALLKRMRASEVGPDEVLQIAGTLAQHPAAPPPVIARARALITEIRAPRLLDEAVSIINGPDWPQAQRALDELLTLPDLSEEISDKGQRVRKVLADGLALQRTLDEVSAERRPTWPSDDPRLVQAALTSAQQRVEAAGGALPDKAVPPFLRPRRNEIKEALSAQLAEVAAELERRERERQAAIERDRHTAQSYLEELKTALDAEQLDVLEHLLAETPELTYWPAGARERAHAIRLELQKRRQIQADHATAQHWADQLRTIVDAGDWDGAGRLLHSEPSISHWPPGVREATRELGRKVRAVLKRQSDEQQAQKWIETVRQAVGVEDWFAAAAALGIPAPAQLTTHHSPLTSSGPPRLEHWPEDIAAERQRHEQEVRAQVTAIEQDHTRARDWLNRAMAAERKGDPVEVLEILESRPALMRWPHGLLAEAQALESNARIRLSERLERDLAARQRAVGKLGEQWIRQVAGAALERYVQPTALTATLNRDEYPAARPDASGRALFSARLTVLGDAHPPLTAQHSAASSQPIEFALDFRYEGGTVHTCDDAEVRTQVQARLVEQVTELQRKRLDELSARWRGGLFPNAVADLRLDGLRDHVAGLVYLLGSGTVEGRFVAELAWDPVRLAWTHVDSAAFTRRAVDLLVNSARKLVNSRLARESAELERYLPMISVEIVAPSVSDDRVLTSGVTLEARLAIRVGSAAPRPLQTLTLKCTQIGKIQFETSLRTAEAALRDMVVAAQNASRDAILSDILARAGSAAAKLKINTFPSPIDQPCDQLTFQLLTKGGERLTFAAPWEPEKFAFAPPEGWLDELAGLLKKRKGFW
ncbi:MAG TPA: serine/threonine-protein kinase [Phycisphaerae bacterium]